MSAPTWAMPICSLHKGDTVGAQTNIDKALDINRFNVGALIFHANLAMQKGKDGFATASPTWTRPSALSLVSRRFC